MAMIIKTDGQVISVQPKNGKDFTLQELKAIVGGYIEIIRMNDKFMVVNEEGKLEQLPCNALATGLYWANVGGNDYIVGDVLVCGIDEIN